MSSADEVIAAVVVRARDLGAELRPGDVRLEYADPAGAASYRLVRATWGAGASYDGLAGLVDSDGAPDLLPSHAIGTLVHGWSGDAAGAAEAVAFVLDPLARWAPLLTPSDVASWRSVDGPVGAPELADDSLDFWWCRDDVAQQMLVTVDDSGHATVNGGRTAVLDDTGGAP